LTGDIRDDTPFLCVDGVNIFFKFLFSLLHGEKGGVYYEFRGNGNTILGRIAGLLHYAERMETARDARRSGVPGESDHQTRYLRWGNDGWERR
jgi:hypothetical protein